MVVIVVWSAVVVIVVRERGGNICRERGGNSCRKRGVNSCREHGGGNSCWERGAVLVTLKASDHGVAHTLQYSSSFIA